MPKVTLLGGAGNVSPVQPIGVGTPGAPGVAHALDPVVEALMEELRRSKGKADTKELEKYRSELDVSASRQKNLDASKIAMGQFKTQNAYARRDKFESTFGRAGPLMMTPEVRAALDRISGIVPDGDSSQVQFSTDDEAVKVLFKAFGDSATALTALDDKIEQEHLSRKGDYARARAMSDRIKDMALMTSDAVGELGNQIFGMATKQGALKAAKSIIEKGNSSIKSIERGVGGEYNVGGLVTARYNAIRASFSDAITDYGRTTTPAETTASMVREAVSRPNQFQEFVQREKGLVSGTPSAPPVVETLRKYRALAVAAEQAANVTGLNQNFGLLAKVGILMENLPAQDVQNVLGTADWGRVRELVQQSGGDPNSVQSSDVLRAVMSLGPNSAGDFQAFAASLKNMLDATVGGTQRVEGAIKPKPGEELPDTVVLSPTQKTFYQDLSREVAKLGLAVDPLVVAQRKQDLLNVRKLEMFRFNYEATGGNTELAARITSTQSILSHLTRTSAELNALRQVPGAPASDIQQAEAAVASTLLSLKEMNPAIGQHLEELYTAHEKALTPFDILGATSTLADQGRAAFEDVGSLTEEDQAELATLESGFNSLKTGAAGADTDAAKALGAKYLPGGLAPRVGDAPRLEPIQIKGLTTPKEEPPAKTPTSGPGSRDSVSREILHSAVDQDPTLGPNKWLAGLDYARRQGMRDAAKTAADKYRAQRASEDAADAADTQRMAGFMTPPEPAPTGQSPKPKKTETAQGPSLAAPFQGAA